MTEPELFAAYRTVDGYATECECGDRIESPTSDETTVVQAIAIHQESTVHQQWRAWQDAVSSLQRPARHLCPCHDHGS